MADRRIHGHEHEDIAGSFTPLIHVHKSQGHRESCNLFDPPASPVFISVSSPFYMRMELMERRVQYMCLEGARLTAAAVGECTPNGHLWNVMITYHGVLMMFLRGDSRPFFGGFGNYLKPLQDRCAGTWRSRG